MLNPYRNPLSQRSKRQFFRRATDLLGGTFALIAIGQFGWMSGSVGYVAATVAGFILIALGVYMVFIGEVFANE